MMNHNLFRRLIRYSKIIVTVILLNVSGFSSIRAQDSLNRIPELNNHVFTYISNIRYPFTNTSFTTNIGIGNADNLNFDINDINGQQILGINGSLAFAHLSFHYQQRIRDWVALYLDAGLSTRLGTDVFSLLSQGINTVSIFKIGWLVRMVQEDKFTLTSNIGITNSSGTFINIRRFVQDVLNNVPNPSIASSAPVLSGDIGLQFAYGFNSVMGLTLESNLTFGESYDRGNAEIKYAFKSAFDLNFKRRYNVPLGFILSYTILTNPEIVYTDDGYGQITGLKLVYTGTNDFLVGIEQSLMSIPLEEVDKQSSFLVSLISIRYYFN